THCSDSERVREVLIAPQQAAAPIIHPPSMGPQDRVRAPSLLRCGPCLPARVRAGPGPISSPPLCPLGACPGYPGRPLGMLVGSGAVRTPDAAVGPTARLTLNVLVTGGVVGSIFAAAATVRVCSMWTWAGLQAASMGGAYHSAHGGGAHE